MYAAEVAAAADDDDDDDDDDDNEEEVEDDSVELNASGLIADSGLLAADIKRDEDGKGAAVCGGTELDVTEELLSIFDVGNV
jgi:hypothetical protein